MIALDTCCVRKCSGDCWAKCPVPSDWFDQSGFFWFCREKTPRTNKETVYWNLFYWSQLFRCDELNYVCSLSKNAGICCHAWNTLITQVVPGVLIQDTYHPWKQSTTWVTRNFCEVFTLWAGKASALQRSQDFQFSRSWRIAPPFHFLPPNFIILQRGRFCCSA